MRYSDWLARLIPLVQDRERCLATGCAPTGLRRAESTDCIALADRAAGTGREHEVGPDEVNAAITMVEEDQRQLGRDRDGASGLIGLRRTEFALSVDLVVELNLPIVDGIKAEVRPGQAKAL